MKKWGILLAVFIIGLGISIVDIHTVKPTETRLMDNQAIYERDTVNSVKNVYLTVFPRDSLFQPKYAYTFQELNQDTDFRDNKEIQVKVLFQEGKDGPPKQGDFGYGLTDANGIMTLRGHSTRNARQKSYKIDLKKKGGLWNGYEIINLNKHPFDMTRIRNKLSFDYLKMVPGITSLRTQFVHLYIKDFSEGNYQQDYKDFGLFTQVENLDTHFLKAHGLDPKGHLYKAENFIFQRYPEQIKLKDAADYREESFEEVLEIKGNDDHSKLITMLEDVNNPFKHINEVIAEHFNRDNYLTWLAVNILFGNVDTNSQNFCLYSPKNSKTWYFLPWDYDGAWGFYEQPGYTRAPWQEGVSNYWENVLHRRFLKNRDNLAALSQKIERLVKIFTPENTRKLLDAYRPVVTYFLTREPDSKYYPWTLAELEKEFDRLPGVIEKNRQVYYKSLEKPMPVHMGRPQVLGKYIVFKWGESYDFQGDQIQYTIDISTSPEFENIIHHQDGIVDTEYVVSGLPPGRYYWRLQIEDEAGNTQVAFDAYKSKDGKSYYSVQEFFVQ